METKTYYFGELDEIAQKKVIAGHTLYMDSVHGGEHNYLEVTDDLIKNNYQYYEGGNICEEQEVKQDMSKEKTIELMLIRIFTCIGIDKPNNFDDIVSFCLEDVNETADPVNWHDGDVAIAFRRWIEAQAENKS